MAICNPTSSSNFVYDVFLSFRGDTRYAFTDHLHTALLRHGINTFRDDHKLRIGDEIRPSLLRAIEASRISMVVLCPNYASSTWCLDELAKIIHCYDHQGIHVSPIFYNVEPSNVRYQKKSYKTAMNKHEKRFGQDSEKVQAWREALSRVCDLSGVHCGHYMYESELIEKIVRDTLSKLPPISSRVEQLVEFDSHSELVNCLMDVDYNDVLKIENPRILITSDATFLIDPHYLPSSSQVFDWKRYPSKSFSPHFHPRRNVDFKSIHSSLIIENPFLQKFEALTFMDLSHCQSIAQIPNMFGAIQLRILILDRCNQLEEFDESIGFMPKLVYLNVSECNMLKRFVPKMYMPSLEVLSFNFCTRLECFPDIVLKMEKPLKISLINTAIKEFPKSINNLVGLEYIDVSMCRRLDDISSSFLLPKLVTLQSDGCYQLEGSFKRFKESQSITNGSPNLVTLYLSYANLSYTDLDIIFENFSKLEHLDVSRNNFASLPSCVTGCSHLKSLDVSYCGNLKEIPELPISVKKVDARYCPSLTSKTSSMLLSKVSQENERIQLVMSKTKISNTFVFDHFSNDGIPLFWARWKFPVIAIAFMFGEAKENDDQIHIGNDHAILDETGKSHVVGLHLFIDDKEICRKDFHYCSVGEHHVLLCDLRTLFSNQEWQGLDEYLGVGWEAIQVQFESCLTLSSWGVYVYKQKTNKNDIKFQPPNSNCIMPPPSSLVPKRTPQMSIQRIRHALENMSPSEIFGELLPISELDDTPGFTKALLRSWRRQKNDFGEELALAFAYGTCLKLELEDRESMCDVIRIVELMKGNVPKHVAESYKTDDMQSACVFMELFLRARLELLKENGVLEASHLGEDLRRGYPNFKAVVFGKIRQLAEPEFLVGCVLGAAAETVWLFIRAV